MSYQFCCFLENDIKNLKEIFNTSFNITEDGFTELFACYEDFKSYYHTDNPKEGRGRFQKIMRQDILPIVENNFVDKFINKDFQIGIDLPVLIKPENPNNKTIFFIGEDPLRSKQDDDIVLSTPFGVHIKTHREHGLTRIYWEVMNKWLSKGYAVYATDIFKVWVNKENEGKEQIKKYPELYKNFKLSLQKEIDWLKPDLIVCYGKPAYEAVSDATINYEDKILHFPHPSGSANGTWAKKLKESGMEGTTQDNKIKHINGKIESKIN